MTPTIGQERAVVDSVPTGRLIGGTWRPTEGIHEYLALKYVAVNL